MEERFGQQAFRRAAAVLAAALLCLLPAAGAHAADRVYWAEFEGRISSANLDGSGLEDLNTPGAIFHSPEGDAIDPLSERIYWLNSGGATPANASISFAALDGSGGGLLPTPGAVFAESAGLAIDPVAGRIYWANRQFLNDAIWSVKLDGSDARELDVTGATIGAPTGVAIDPVARRIYWANDASEPGKNMISFADLDRPGQGGDLPTPGAPDQEPEGLALDPVGRRVYWANLSGGSIGVAKLDGSGGEALNTSGATVAFPRGVAVDPFAGRVYWANGSSESPISFARIDGSGGGGDLKNGQNGGPTFPLLRVSPRSTAAPAIAGGSTPGAALSCSQGTWAPDFIESFLYQAPQGFSYQWSRNGADIPGATQSTLKADDPRGGEYGCRVSAQNASGATSRASRPHHIAATVFVGATKVLLSLAAPRMPAKAPIVVRVSNGNEFAISGLLSGKASARVGSGQKRTLKLSPKRFAVAAQAKAIVKLRLPKPLQLLLAQKHKLSIALTAVARDSTGHSRKIKGRVAPRLR
jgi:DNA-binding beta-propeller fold protein YncE